MYLTKVILLSRGNGPHAALPSSPSQVTVFVRDVKLVRAMGWLSRLIRKSIKDSAKNQASQNLSKMAEAETTLGLVA